MRIQWKVIVLVLLVLTGTISAVVWKTQNLILEDKISFITESNIKQMAPLRKLVDTRLTQGKEQLVEFAAHRASGKSPAYGEFEVVSLVQPGEGGQWSPVWVDKGPEAKSERWPQGYDVTLLKSLPYSKVRDGEVTWTRLSDTQGSPIYALMVSVEIQAPGSGAAVESSSAQLPETTDYGALAPAGSGRKAIVVGFASANPLAAVAEDYIGSINSVFVVDDKGYVAAHTSRGYLGALFNEDPIVKEIIKSQKTTGTGQFENLENRPVIGHFERIEHSNVYAVITTPMESATGLVDAYSRLALVTGVSVGVIGLLLAWLIGRNMSSQLQRTISAVQEINRGGSIAGLQPFHTKDEIGVLTQQLSEAFRKLSGASEGATDPSAAVEMTANAPENMPIEPVKSDDPFAEMLQASRAMPAVKSAAAPVAAELSPERLADERRAAFEAFNEGFAAAVKEPLLAILGHAQLARAKSENSELKSHADSIEREARRAKEVIERFRDFDNEPAALPESDRMNLEQVVKGALAREESALNADDIDVVLDLKSVPDTKGYAPQMEAALVHVIENAREAMVNRAARKLMVTLKDEGDALALEVADTGIGMSRDVKEKAFDPFFRGFENPRRMGLGLSLVQAAIKRIGATCEIESSPGEGTRFKLKFKVTTEDRKAFEAEPVVVAAFAEKARAERPAEVAAGASAVAPPNMTPTPPPIVSPAPPPPMEALSETVVMDAPPPLTPTPASVPPMFAGLESKPVADMNFPPTPPPDPKREYTSDKKVETWAPKAPPPPIAMGMIEDDDDDDDDEQFANVALNVAVSMKPSGPPVVESKSVPPVSDIKVKIRRPKSTRGTKN